MRPSVCLPFQILLMNFVRPLFSRSFIPRDQFNSLFLISLIAFAFIFERSNRFIAKRSMRAVCVFRLNPSSKASSTPAANHFSHFHGHFCHCLRLHGDKCDKSNIAASQLSTDKTHLCSAYVMGKPRSPAEDTNCLC